MSSELLKKMVTKDVMGEKFNPKQAVDALGAVDLYSVFGVCNGIIPDETNYGSFFRLLGTFEAHRFPHEPKVDKEKGIDFGGVVEATLVSSVCILPEPAGNMMGQKLLAVIQEEKQAGVDVKVGEKTRKKYDVKSAQFALVVGLKPSTKGARGYEWTVRPLVEPSGVDALTDLRNKVQAALPAPKAETKKK